MAQKITGVQCGSIAEELGLEAGDELLSINGEPVCDLIDYEYFSAMEDLTLLIRKKDGETLEASVEKDPYEGLGLDFETSLMSGTRQCCNHCVFCFVEQLPKGLRKTLYVKDDDWRLSFIMGNYITMTNDSDREIERIIKRHVSPLYISVHATDPELRVRMMQQPRAAKLLEQLDRLIAGAFVSTARWFFAPAGTTGSSSRGPSPTSGRGGRGPRAWLWCLWACRASGRG